VRIKGRLGGAVDIGKASETEQKNVLKGRRGRRKGRSKLNPISGGSEEWKVSESGGKQLGKSAEGTKNSGVKKTGGVGRFRRMRRREEGITPCVGGRKKEAAWRE